MQQFSSTFVVVLLVAVFSGSVSSISLASFPIVIQRKPDATSTGTGMSSANVLSFLNLAGSNPSATWIDATSNYLACVDGRVSRSVLSCPGGDLGAFIVALAGFQDLGGSAANDSAVLSLLSGFMTGNYVSSSRNIYMHTDSAALLSISSALGYASNSPLTTAQILGFNSTMQTRFLTLLSSGNLSYIGCNHLRSMIQNPTLYEVNSALVLSAIKAFFSFAWSSPANSARVFFESLPGTEAETAWITIEGQSNANPTLQPAFPHLVGSQSAFIFAPLAQASLNAKFTPFFAPQLGLTTALAQAQYASELADLTLLHQVQSQDLVAFNVPWFDLFIVDQSQVQVVYNNIVEESYEQALVAFIVLWILTLIALGIIIWYTRSILCVSAFAKKYCKFCVPSADFHTLDSTTMSSASVSTE